MWRFMLLTLCMADTILWDWKVSENELNEV